MKRASCRPMRCSEDLVVKWLVLRFQTSRVFPVVRFVLRVWFGRNRVDWLSFPKFAVGHRWFPKVRLWGGVAFRNWHTVWFGGQLGCVQASPKPILHFVSV